MAALAGMIDRVDRETGRLIADLEKSGELDNTLIVFLSDNGACPYDRPSTGMDKEPYLPNTKWSDSTGWAWARNTPFRNYKQNQHEGGISTPAIFHWPKGITAKPGSISAQPAHLVDLLPTIAEISGAKVPDSFPGRELTPLAGTSITPVLAGREMESRPPIHLLFEKDRGLRDGDWKIVSLRNNPWELYNIAEDRTELNNLAAKHPEQVAAMSKQWHEMAENVLLSPSNERKPVATEDGNMLNPEWSDYSGKHGSLTSPSMIRQSQGKKGK
jgi:arylsulfatase